MIMKVHTDGNKLVIAETKIFYFHFDLPEDVDKS